MSALKRALFDSMSPCGVSYILGILAACLRV